MTTSPESKLSVGLGIACFIVPFLGVVIWLREKANSTRKARMALLLSIYPSLIIFIGPCMARRSNTLRDGTNSENVSEVAYTYEIVYEDVYDITIKTQVERRIVVTGEISHEQLNDLLLAQYDEIVSSTGYENREHPNAVYVYVYAPGGTDADWMGRIEKSAVSNSPSIHNQIVVGATIHTSSYLSPSQVIENQINASNQDTPSVSAASTVSNPNRFEKSGEVVSDNVTGLQWRVGPDVDTSFNDAVDWVNSLNGDWRMPTAAELTSLYQAGVANDDEGLVWSSPFYNTGCWVWSSDHSDNTSARSLYFWGGNVSDYDRDFKMDGRVFAVR